MSNEKRGIFQQRSMIFSLELKKRRKSFGFRISASFTFERSITQRIEAKTNAERPTTTKMKNRAFLKKRKLIELVFLLALLTKWLTFSKSTTRSTKSTEICRQHWKCNIDNGLQATNDKDFRLPFDFLHRRRRKLCFSLVFDVWNATSTVRDRFDFFDDFWQREKRFDLLRRIFISTFLLTCMEKQLPTVWDYLRVKRNFLQRQIYRYLPILELRTEFRSTKCREVSASFCSSVECRHFNSKIDQRKYFFIEILVSCVFLTWPTTDSVCWHHLVEW